MGTGILAELYTGRADRYAVCKESGNGETEAPIPKGTPLGQLVLLEANLSDMFGST
jgi:hypothetical protein